MNDSDNTSDMLEQFLDGMLSKEQQESFFVNYDGETLAETQAVQRKIDASLRQMYSFEPFDTTREKEIARQAFQSDLDSRSTAQIDTISQKPRPLNVSQRHFLIAALAASVMVITASGLWFMNSATNDPFFESRPVALLYQETVQAGFQPYYNCEDDQRFADTFEFRQGKALALSDLPDGTRMLGLSYLGGISRDTTAMLGEVDGHEVIVFVDRIDAGKPIVTTDDDSTLNVFVVKRDGLVFAEVSPLSEARLIQYFKVLNE